MVNALAQYGKYSNLDKEDETSLPYEDIATQPFCATLDVRVLGIEPIPDYNNYVARLVKELSRDNRDIEDVEFEEPDLEEKQLLRLSPMEQINPKAKPTYFNRPQLMAPVDWRPNHCYRGRATYRQNRLYRRSLHTEDDAEDARLYRRHCCAHLQAWPN